jgi:hypothetical protein
MSKGIEKLLKRMIAPNADLRCNATEAMADAYWSSRVESAVHSALFFLLRFITDLFYFISFYLALFYN